MKRVAWIALPAILVVTLVSGVYLVAGRAQAQRSAASQVQAATFRVQGSGNLSNRGGPVQTQPVSYLIFWGSSWSSSGALTADAQVVRNYFTDVGGTFYLRTLTQYSGISDAHTLGGVYLDTSTPTTDTSCNGKITVEDSAIQSEVSKAITAQGWTPDYNNATFYVYTPSGMVINDGNGACAPRQFCAYHNWSSSGFAYAALAYPSDTTGCGVSSSPNGNAAGDSLASLSARVQFGAITDPRPGVASGWLDNASYEIGDKCGWDTSAGLIHLKNGHTYALQTEYSNATSSCVGAYNAHFQSATSAVALTTAPGISPADQTFKVTNTGDAPLSWSAAALPAWVSLSPTSGTVAIGGSTSLTLHFTIPTGDPAQTYTTTLILSDPNADNTLSVPITIVAANVSTQWYFAEGFTGNSFSEYLTLANPNAVAAHVHVVYLRDSASPVQKDYVVAAKSRFTRLVNTDVGAGYSVSMAITSDIGIVAERPMYFSYRLASGPTVSSGDDTLGATALAQDYAFGYLDATANHDTWLTVLNNNSAAMTVTVQYYQAATGALTTAQHTVPAQRRGTFKVANDVPAGTYSAMVHLSAPGLVERPMYLIDGTTGYPGATDVIGVPGTQTAWYFAEGATSFSERYILSNPCPTAGCSGAPSANATVTFYRPDGSTAQTTVSIPSGQQRVVSANGVLGNGVSNSAKVTSNNPILAERFMSFTFHGMPGATDVLGANAVTNLFYFAEGNVSSTFSEYLTIENPDTANTATVTVTFLPSNGSTPIVRVYTIGPSTRFTLNTGTVLSGSFSMAIESNLPIVAERPMYFSYGGQMGGSDVVGYQP
jgi:hypothetical protein